MTANLNLILASASPRRRQLLELIDPEFTLAPAREVEEVYDPRLPVEQVPVALSRLKAQAYSDLAEAGSAVITADTVVIIDGQILGKPANEAEARQMLRRLSGRTHHVITGVTVHTADRMESFSTTTEVNFGPLTDEEIDHYVEKYRPLDKAGAYGVQEFIGCIGIKSIRGCFYNVMGLPLHDLYRHLIAIGQTPE